VGSRWAGLTRRISSAVVLAAVSFGLIWWGVLPFAAEVVLLALAGSAEFYDMVERKGLRPLRRSGTLAVLAVVAAACFGTEIMLMHLLLGLFLLFMGMVVLRTETRQSAMLDACATWTGVLYVGWLFSYCLLIRRLDGGAYLLTWLILSVAATDVAAYFVGRQFGRHKLWAKVSPKKTLEGSFGGTLGAVLVSTSCGLAWGLPAWQGAALGALISVGGQIGDLWESALKRDVGVKDAGDLIGGHGGALDRFDSLAFAAPIFYLCWTLVPHL